MSKCNNDEISIKANFLGPQSENADWLRHEILTVLDHWFSWRQDKFTKDGKAISRDDQKSRIFKDKREIIHLRLKELCARFENEIPQFSPRYIGHMYSEISLPAILGHFVALLHNPNNISSEASVVGAKIEQEAIGDLLEMIGISPSRGNGHFTSGGTIANIEALWRARFRLDHNLSLGTFLNLEMGYKLTYFQAANMSYEKYQNLIEEHQIDEQILKNYSHVINGPWNIYDKYLRAFKSPPKSPIVFVPSSKHYSWPKAISLLGLGNACLRPLKLTKTGTIDISYLKSAIQSAQEEDCPVMMIVSVAGTTELGTCDPINEIQDFLDEKLDDNIFLWHHVDAAYGGYFCSLKNTKTTLLKEETQKALASIKRVQSITIDPHKLGYTPYSCGAILVSDQKYYNVSNFEARYIQSPNSDIDRWMKTLEGSRAATGAIATYMGSRALGLNEKGHGMILEKTLQNKMVLTKEILEQCPQLKILDAADLNLLCLSVIQEKKTLKEINSQTDALIKMINDSGDYFISKTYIKKSDYTDLIVDFCHTNSIEDNDEGLLLLRLTLMNPFFLTKETNLNYVKSFVNTLKKYLE